MTDHGNYILLRLTDYGELYIMENIKNRNKRKKMKKPDHQLHRHKND